MHSKTIGEFTFEMAKLPGWTSFEYFMRLAQALGPAIIPLKAMAMGIKKDKPLDVGEVMVAVIASGSTVDIDKLMPILKVLVKDALVKTSAELKPLAPVFDELLRGDIDTIFRLMIWSIEVNFLPFLLKLKNAVGARVPASDTNLSSAPSNSSGGPPRA